MPAIACVSAVTASLVVNRKPIDPITLPSARSGSATAPCTSRRSRPALSPYMASSDCTIGRHRDRAFSRCLGEESGPAQRKPVQGHTAVGREPARIDDPQVLALDEAECRPVRGNDLRCVSCHDLGDVGRRQRARQRDGHLLQRLDLAHRGARRDGHDCAPLAASPKETADYSEGGRNREIDPPPGRVVCVAGHDRPVHEERERETPAENDRQQQSARGRRTTRSARPHRSGARRWVGRLHPSRRGAA